MIKKWLKKLVSTVCVVGTALVLSNAFGSLNTKAYGGDITINSKGNIVMNQTAGDGSVTSPVAIYTSDIIYLKNEIQNLKSQLTI